MKIVCQCRFGCLDQPDVAVALHGLWHPVRMALRFHLLEQFLLPSLRAQSDGAFIFVLLTSAEMPEPYHDRLARVTAGIAQLRLLRAQAGEMTAALAPLMAEVSLGFTAPSVHLHVAEDMALAVDHIARLRGASGRVDPGGMISFPAGVLGFVDGAVARQCAYRQPSSIIVAPAQPQRQHAAPPSPDYAASVACYTDPMFPAFHTVLHSGLPVPGYEDLFPKDGSQRRRILKSVQQNPELAAGGVVTAEAAAALAQAFGYTSGDALRDAVRRTADPVSLAAEMGFPLQPLARA